MCDVRVWLEVAWEFSRTHLERTCMSRFGGFILKNFQLGEGTFGLSTLVLVLCMKVSLFIREDHPRSKRVCSLEFVVSID